MLGGDSRALGGKTSRESHGGKKKQRKKYAQFADAILKQADVRKFRREHAAEGMFRVKRRQQKGKTREIN